MAQDTQTIHPAGQYLIIADAFLQEIARTGKTLIFHFAGQRGNLTVEIEQSDLHTLSLALLLLDQNPKVQKVTA